MNAAETEIIERCALLLDAAAAHYLDYANRYDDEDGDRAELQSRTCKQQAEAIRRLKK